MARVLFTNVKVFDGTGSASFPGSVLVSDGRIEAVGGAGETLAAPGAATVDGRGGTLMPGLVESHAHLGFAAAVDNPVGFGPMLPPDVRSAATAHAGKVMLDYGFTSAYSGGGVDAPFEVGLRGKFDSGELPGPRFKACSFERDGAKASHGGPGTFEGIAIREPDVEGMRGWAKAMIELGVDSLKFVLSGESGIRPGTSRLLQFYDAEIEAAAQEAAEGGVWMNAHAHSSEAIQMALRHGVRVLYHCTWADEETVDMLEAHKDHIFVAPAPGINWANIHEGERFGITKQVAEAQEQFETLERVSRLMPELKKRGIRVLPGGDYGFPWNPIGKNARDLELFVKLFGFSPAEALMAATKQGGEIMGMADELGLVKAGYLADLVLVDGDPLQDIAILQDAGRLTAIMKGGRFHKAPAAVGETAAAH